MIQMRSVCRAACATLLALSLTQPAASSTPVEAAAGRWTLPLIVEAPHVSELVLLPDGNHALYLVRQASVAADGQTSVLWKIDLSTGKRSELLRASRLQSLQLVPGTRRWSVLANIGAGLQLYVADDSDHISPLVVRSNGVILGSSPNSDTITATDGPEEYGVTNYHWSPDGRHLWYATATRAPDNLAPGVVDDLQFYMYCIRGPRNELHVLTPSINRDTVVSRSFGNPIWQYSSGHVAWSSDSQTVMFQFVQENHDGTRSTIRGNANAATGENSSAPLAKLSFDIDQNVGPSGGLLAVDPLGKDRLLVETFPGNRTRSYGRVDFHIDAPASWKLSPESVAIAVLHVDNNRRAGVVRIGPKGDVSDLDPVHSLHDCFFPADKQTGICVQEEINLPPRLAVINLRAWRIERTFTLDQRYDHISPLRVEPRNWTDRNGIRSTGFIVYPRNYTLGKRYPALFVTHSGDANQSFVSEEFQWQFPIQLFAERGYVVICINDPGADQSAAIRQAYSEWAAGTGTMKPAEIRRWIWLEGVAAIEDVAHDLDKEGLVNTDQLGIAGYSRGSQMVDVIVSQSKLFKAASSGDGGYPEPAGYWTLGYVGKTYKQIYGGSPYDPRFYSEYRAFAPAFRADLVRTAVLSQITGTGIGRGNEFDAALREAGIPHELVLFPWESHILHRPANRLLAMQQNIDWFDFWLLGKVDSDPTKEAEYDRWRAMRMTCHERLGGADSFCQ